MLTFCILFSLLVFAFYSVYRHSIDSHEVVLLFLLFSLCVIWGVYLLVDNTLPNFYILISILSINVLLLVYIYKFDKPKDVITIKAQQQNYWGIDSQYIINTFKHLMKIKEDRIEVDVKIENMYFIDESVDYEKKIISPFTIKYFKKMEENYIAPVVNNLDEISKLPLENKIFQRVKFMLEQKLEVFLNYEDELKKFDNRVDFFLIYLWDKYSKVFNIGIGQLESLVVNDENKQEFINAIDGMNLSSMKLRGSYLQYKYYEFIEKKGIEC